MRFLSLMAATGVAFAHILAGVAHAEIPVPTDAPKPKSPSESQKAFHLAEGYRIELVTSEPAIAQPSGVCWDAKGRLFVSELHGYNLEGQFDIEELNKTGELDRVVRRVQAGAEARQAAEAGTFGVIKQLRDADGDGIFESFTLFADRLPACHGLCAALDGLIATCSSQIYFLADRDGDGIAEVRDVLFDGFPSGRMERSINSPRWTPDGWIEICSAGFGGTISGAHLPQPIHLPHADFRIRADGSAIEPVLGSSHTFGAAKSERGERIVISTSSPGIAVAPILWRYLQRNPDYAPGRLETSLGSNRTYPISQPHPWRTRRAEDPGFSKFYTDKYGIMESAPNGYFTSACSPLVYLDTAIPELHGQLLTCEPAQNMVHRGLLQRDGVAFELSRAPGEETAEFLASRDSWFNPIALTHGPDGSIYIVDFYREIIEDYSAIPRYLQQQYGLVNGNDYGRIWRLTHVAARREPVTGLEQLSNTELVAELRSPLIWRRETANRLLLERHAMDVAPDLRNLVGSGSQPATSIIAIQTLAALQALDPQTALAGLSAGDAGVLIQALQQSEVWCDRDDAVFYRIVELSRSADPCVVLQTALTLGESDRSEATDALAEIARKHAGNDWMNTAILSSVSGRAGELVAMLLKDPGSVGNARILLAPLASMIAARHDSRELSEFLQFLPGIRNAELQQICWNGLLNGLPAGRDVELSLPAIGVLKETAQRGESPQVAAVATRVIRRLSLETAEERQARIELSLQTIADVQGDIALRLAAVEELGEEREADLAPRLLNMVPEATPKLREAILGLLFSRPESLPAVMNALDDRSLPTGFLTALQRDALLKNSHADVQQRAAALFQQREADLQQKLASYVAALKNPRNVAHGETLFKKYCATCHQAHGQGFAVGPDLSAEAKRSEETILKDLADPSGTIAANYGTFLISLSDGRVLTGLLAAESASSLTLKQPEGKTQSLLRKEIEEVRASPISLMPDNLLGTLQPQDVADVLAWLRNPSPSQK